MKQAKDGFKILTRINQKSSKDEYIYLLGVQIISNSISFYLVFLLMNGSSELGHLLFFVFRLWRTGDSLVYPLFLEWVNLGCNYAW